MSSHLHGLVSFYLDGHAEPFKIVQPINRYINASETLGQEKIF